MIHSNDKEHEQRPLSDYQGPRRFSLTGVVETTADLHGSQLTVETNGPGRICSDLTGIFVPAFTAAICNTEQNLSGWTVKGREGQRDKMDVLNQRVKPGVVNMNLRREMIWCLRGKEKNRGEKERLPCMKQKKDEEINRT